MIEQSVQGKMALKETLTCMHLTVCTELPKGFSKNFLKCIDFFYVSFLCLQKSVIVDNEKSRQQILPKPRVFSS